jgi:hypothetical protein
MSAQEMLAQQIVAAVIRLAGRGTTARTALPVPSFGDVEAAVREHFKMKEVDATGLVEAVRKAASTRHPEAIERALSDLVAAHGQALVAAQQTAFLIALEVGRTTGTGGAWKREWTTTANTHDRPGRRIRFVRFLSLGAFKDVGSDATPRVADAANPSLRCA